MKYINLGSSDLKVSSIGLGCMGMTHAYGAPSDESEMIKLIHTAVDMGITFFDTAECYTGFDKNGQLVYNEELVGKALKPYRDKVVIATKFGVHHNSDLSLKTNSRPEIIRKSIEGSLARLGTDYIDLYYQHRVDPDVPVEEVAGTVQDLIREGKVRCWGMSEVTEDTIRRADKVCHLTAVQNRYSMMCRHYENLIPILKEMGIAFVAHSPMANGYLTGKYDGNSEFDKKNDYRSFMPQFKGAEKNKELLELLKSTAEKISATPAQISLAWMMSKSIIPIPGTRKLNRLEENAGAADITLSADETSEIDTKLNTMKMSEVFGGHIIKK